MINQNNINDIINAKTFNKYENIISNTSHLIQIITGIRSLINDKVSNFSITVNDFKSIISIIYGDEKNPGVFDQLLLIDKKLSKLSKIRSKKIREKIIDFIFDEMRMMIKKIKKISKISKKINTKGLENIQSIVKIIDDLFSSFDKVKIGIQNEIKINIINNTFEDIIDIFKNIIMDTWLIGLSNNTAMVSLFKNVNEIIDIINRLSELNITKILMVSIKINMISNIIDKLIEIFKFNFKLLLSSFGGIHRLFSNIFEIFKNINNSGIKFSDILKFMAIESCMDMINEIISKTLQFVWKVLIIPIPLLSKSKAIFNILVDLFNKVSEIKLFLTFTKFRKLYKSISRIKLILDSLRFIWKSVLIPLPLLLKVNLIFHLLVGILDKVSQVKLFLTFTKFNKLYHSISRIRLILMRLNHIGGMRRVGKTIVRLVIINIIFGLLLNVLKKATLAGLISMGFSLVGPLLLLSIIIIVQIVKILSRLGRGLGKTILNLSIIGIVMFLLTTIATNILALSLIAVLVIKNIPQLVLFLLSLIPILLSIIAIGYVVSLMAFAAIPAVIGVGALAIMVGVIVTIAGQLAILEKIKLNDKLILENTRKILSTVKYIITGLFSEDDSKDIRKDMKGAKGGIGLIKSIFKSSDLLTQSLASSVLLIMSLISISAILLISFQLVLLSKIKLNITDIRSNVKIILGLCKDIIGFVFKDESMTVNDTNDNEKVGWFKGIFQTIGNSIKGIGNIIGTLMSSVILVSSLISITAILLIAGCLKLISNINLNETDIITNLNKVLLVCDKLTDLIFNPNYKTLDEKSGDEKKSGWLTNIFKGIGGIITLVFGSVFLLTSLLSISLLFLLAKELNAISKLSIDEEIITKNVNNIFSTIDSIIDIITSPAEKPNDNDENTTFFSKLLNIVDPRGTLSLLASMGRISLYVGAIGLVKLLADQLISLNKLPDFSNMDTKINSLFNTVDSIVNIITNKNIDNKKIKGVNKKLSKIMSIFETIYDKDFDNSIVDARINMLDNLINVYERFYQLNDFEDEKNNPIKNLVKIVKSINDVKIAKFDKFESVLRTMDDVAQNISDNFQKLADVLEKRIIPSLDNINKYNSSFNIEQTQTSTQSQTSTTSQPTNQSDMDNTIKAQLAQQLVYDSETLGYMEEIVRLLKTNKFRVITT